MVTSLLAARGEISIKSALWKRFRALLAAAVVVEPAYPAKGSSGSGVGIGAMVESAQATQASQVEAEMVAEDVIVDEALAEVMDETVAVEELLATEPLDGVMEELVATEPLDGVMEELLATEPLDEVMEEPVATEPLDGMTEEPVATVPLDETTEEPAAELAESVGDERVADGWFADGC